MFFIYNYKLFTTFFFDFDVLIFFFFFCLSFPSVPLVSRVDNQGVDCIRLCSIKVRGYVPTFASCTETKKHKENCV